MSWMLRELRAYLRSVARGSPRYDELHFGTNTIHAMARLLATRVDGGPKAIDHAIECGFGLNPRDVTDPLVEDAWTSALAIAKGDPHAWQYEWADVEIYARKLRLVVRRTGKTSLTGLGQATLELPTPKALSWLVACEVEQSLGS